MVRPFLDVMNDDFKLVLLLIISGILFSCSHVRGQRPLGHTQSNA